MAQVEWPTFSDLKVRFPEKSSNGIQPAVNFVNFTENVFPIYLTTQLKIAFMPLNKNQMIRAQILDECLSNMVKWHSVDDLLEKVNDYLVREVGQEPISRRTLYSDLERLQHPDLYNAELEKKVINRKMYYRYKDRHFSIHNSPISPQQLTELQHILQGLERLSNFPFGEWLDSLRQNHNWVSGTTYSGSPVIGMDHNPDLQGIQFFTQAFQAITHQQVLSIAYRDFAGKKFKYIFHPYYLKQYNQRWFLIGRNDAAPDVIWNLALDRIQSMDPTENTYIPTRIDFEDYFYDVIGVTHHRDAQVETILLHFSPDSLPYVLTKPLHPTQKNRKVDGQVLIQIKVKPNYELFSVLRSFGKNVEVLEPASVREAFVAELRASMAVYGTE